MRIGLELLVALGSIATIAKVALGYFLPKQERESHREYMERVQKENQELAEMNEQLIKHNRKEF